MPARRRDQGGQSVDQFQWRHEQADTAAGAGLVALVDQMVRVDLAQSFEREDRTGAVAEQALKAGSVGGLDTHAGIEAETAAVIPGIHFLRKLDALLISAQVNLQDGSSHSRQQSALDRLAQRIERIERRLEIAPQ